MFLLAQTTTKNAWILRPAIKLEAGEALEAAMREIVPEGKTLEEALKNYRIGSGSGEYDAKKYQTFGRFVEQGKGSDRRHYQIV